MQYRSIFFFLLIAFGLFFGSRVIIAHADQTSGVFVFLRDMRFGSRGEDVKKLQEYLNLQGTPVASEGEGSRGNETTYYGRGTRDAVVAFQELHKKDILVPLNLNVGTGNFYSATRNFVNTSLSQHYDENAVRPLDTDEIGHYSIGGEITGIDAPVMVYNNGESLYITPDRDAHFVFSKKLTSGDAYAIRVEPLLISQMYCHVSSPSSGIVKNADIMDIHIMCTRDSSYDPFLQIITGGRRPSSATYTVGGTVSNLLGSLTLENSNGENLVLSGSGSFDFDTPLSNGSSYSITVASHPSSPQQLCSVAHGQGTIRGSSISSVEVTCHSVPAITFDNISKTYGDSVFALAASSTSDGTITYTSSNTSTVTISGNMATIVGAGSAIITAIQAESSNYGAASTTAILTVAKADPVIASFNDLEFDTADYTGICFENLDQWFCPVSMPLRMNFPTSTSNGAFTALTASNADVIATSTDSYDYVVGHRILDVTFNLTALEFGYLNVLTPGPFSTTAILHQAATANYNAASVTFDITMNLTNTDPEGNFCFNNGVMFITTSETYECVCPAKFTGQYCQTLIPD